MRRPTLARIWTATIASIIMVFGLAAPAAHATTPVTATGIVTDTTDTISPDGINRIEEAVDALRAEDGVTMYLVVVDTFANPSDGFEWATE
ncbi:MAG: TPM domain-containing protein, partial [Pseudoclavibacter sp.]